MAISELRRLSNEVDPWGFRYLLLVLVAGCAVVDPRADYKAARKLIGSRVDSSEVFDPTAEELVEGKVSELLEGDLTARFLLKVVAVFFVAVSVFVYYLWDLRRFGSE